MVSINTAITPKECARLYRVGTDKIRAWIRRGHLEAINVATDLCGKPRWVITPQALEKFERLRQAAQPPKPIRRRRPQCKDFFPDL